MLVLGNEDQRAAGRVHCAGRLRDLPEGKRFDLTDAGAIRRLAEQQKQITQEVVFEALRYSRLT